MEFRRRGVQEKGVREFGSSLASEFRGWGVREFGSRRWGIQEMGISIYWRVQLQGLTRAAFCVAKAQDAKDAA